MRPTDIALQQDDLESYVRSLSAREAFSLNFDLMSRSKEHSELRQLLNNRLMQKDCKLKIIIPIQH